MNSRQATHNFLCWFWVSEVELPSGMRLSTRWRLVVYLIIGFFDEGPGGGDWTAKRREPILVRFWCFGVPELTLIGVKDSNNDW